METDRLLRRVEINTVVICGATAAAAFALAHGALWPPVGVLAGGLLIFTSYWSIKAGLSNLLHTTSARDGVPFRAPRWPIALQLAGRYALLGFMAYVMIARLRLHPVALLAGAVSFVGAVAVEAVRLFVKKS